MVNDSTPCLDDIFRIDKPELAKYIPDLYTTYMYLQSNNKANALGKQSSLF